MKLTELKRFVNSKNKIPTCKWKDENNWLTYDEALKNAKEKNLDISIVLGKINDEYTLAGIDFDTVRDIKSGMVDKDVYFGVKPFKHIHNSISGYGLHILCLVKNDTKLLNGMKTPIKTNMNIERYDENNNKKMPEVEFYTQDKLFVIPLDTDITKDNIVDSTQEYLDLYHKYFKSNVSSQFNSKYDESKKDFILIINAIKKGLSYDEIYKQFMTSDYANNKDSKHKDKLFNRKDYFDRTYNNALNYLNKENNKIDEINNKEEEKTNVFDDILKLVENNPLFIDERNVAYMVNNNYQNIKIDDKKFDRFLIGKCYANKVKFNPQAIANVKSYLLYKAELENNMVELNTRFGGNNEEIYYQLNEKEMVVINKNGYKINDINRPLFRWLSISREQDKPINTNDMNYLKKMMNSFNIDKEQKLIFLVYIISLFIPNIPKPVLIIQAEKESGKTTNSKKIKSLVDPSAINLTGFPKNEEILAQMLDHSALINFDNLNKLEDWQSDALCRAYSGENFAKRSLFSDDDDFLFKYKSAIMLNGINCPALREDLLDRSIIINLKRIKDYKEETLIFKEWNDLKPYVLDNIFKVIPKSLNIYDSISLTNLARTADWCKWGYCIAEVLEKEFGIENNGNQFIKDYNRNIDNQNKQVIDSNIVAQSLIEFMLDKNVWEGTASALYNILKTISLDYGIVGFPKNSSWLTRELNKLITVLESQNLRVITGKSTNKGSVTIIEKIV